MSLFSFFRKNKQESASGSAPGAFLSRAASESPELRGNSSRSRSATATKARKSGKEDPSDPLLPEKKRARRRLIGAIALVLAMVIVLPMIFDSQPHAPTDGIVIRIPSRDGADAETTKPRSADAAPARAAPQPETTEAAKADGPAAAPGSASKPDDKSLDKAVGPNDADPKQNEAAQQNQLPQPDESARALAILEGKTAAASKKPAAVSGKLVIQVAALASQEKIDELRGKLSKAGIASFTQKVATQNGERTRIRVGPFATREEANRMRVRINRLGLNATIVAS